MTGPSTPAGDWNILANTGDYVAVDAGAGGRVELFTCDSKRRFSVLMLSPAEARELARMLVDHANHVQLAGGSR